MNWWGFVVKSKTGRVIFHDYGYETEEEAEIFGRVFIKHWCEGDEDLIVNQRWSEIDEDPNEFVDEEDDDD